MAETIHAGENAAITEVGPPATGSRYYSPTEGRVHLAGFFNSRTDAENAVARLETLGVARTDISLILQHDGADAAQETDETIMYDAGDPTVSGTHVNSKAGEGAGAGSVLGGTVGAILGALAATATAIAIPGLGILIAGPIAGALAGAGAGGLTGGVFGALVGAGLPTDTAQTFESGVHAGGVVVVADVPEHLAGDARLILNAPVAAA